MRLMSSAKTERLVNLTMALLGTKRFMTRSEIFRRVAGYSGSSETKERMFERDKDDLRTLGIEIEVASHDPLFEDEVGYRIRAELFQLREKFDSEELGLVSLALGLIGGSEFGETTHSLSRRINSLAVSPITPEEFRLSEIDITEEGLTELLKALSERRSVTFHYRKEGTSKDEDRRVNPLGLSAWRGGWYLVGEDLDRDDVRVFKLSRISSRIDASGPSNAYVIPEDFSAKDYLVMLKPGEYSVAVKVRRALALNLRNFAEKVTQLDDDWDLLKVNFKDREQALREILWMGPDAVIEEPAELRLALVESLKKLVASHG
jgi:proteasome accessory factor B